MEENNLNKNKSKHFFLRIIAANGILAALYVILTVVGYPLSHGFMQVRISEMLNLFVFFNPTYTIGLTIGCLLANLFSMNGIYDIIIGTLATLIGCVTASLFARFVKNLFFTGWFPCLVNAIVVPFVIILSSLGTGNEMALTATNYFMMFGFVLLGEAIAILAIGYPIMMILMKTVKNFGRSILTTRNMDFKW